MTKKLKYLLSLSSILFLSFFILNTKDTGYASENDTIYLDEEDITSEEGWIFENSTNTLYLDNSNLENTTFETYDDLNIRVSGECTISKIIVLGTSKNTLKIYGPGTLNIKYTGTGGDSSNDAFIYVEPGNVILKNLTLNIDVTHKKKGNSIINCEGKVTIQDCKITSNIKGAENHSTSKYHINCQILNIKNSELTFNGTLGGIYIGTNKKSYITNSSINITSTKEKAGSCLTVTDGKLYIVDSKLNLNSNVDTVEVSGGSELHVKNSNLKICCVGTRNYATMFLMSSKLICSENSKITVSGTSKGIYSNDSTILLKSGTLNVTGKKEYALEMSKSFLDANGSILKISGGKLKLNGKKYGLHATNADINISKGTLESTSSNGTGIYMRTINDGKSRFTINGGTVKATGKSYGLSLSEGSKLSFKKGTLTLTGKKYAINKISKLPKITKKNTVKAGSKKANAKKPTKLKKNYKYIYYKIK